MKLHLPLPLRSALLAVCAVSIVTPVAVAGDDEQDSSNSLNIESIAQMLCSVSELKRTSAAEATDLYWGAGQTGGSVILGRDGSSWSTQSGTSGTEEWEDGKNVHLEARGGTITVTASTLLMKSLTFAPSSATYNFILPTVFMIGPGEPSLLSVGEGTTLCLQGKGSLMTMYGTGEIDGLCQVEGSLKIEEGVSVRMNIAKAEINSLTLTNGYLVVGEGTIQNLQGTCEGIQSGPYGAGLEAGNTLTIVDGEYTGKLKTDWGKLIIEGKFKYDTPGTDEEEKYKNRATVAALTVNKQFTLNGVMETRSTLDGKGSIIGKGTLQFGDGLSEFKGEVGVNITCNGNAGSKVTLSHYTGKNVTLNNGGKLILSNKVADIQLTTLHIGGKLEVEVGKLRLEKSITWEDLGSLHFFSSGQSVVFVGGVRWDKELEVTNGKLTIILDEKVLGIRSYGDITLLDWSLRRDGFDFRDYFEISLDGDHERYENLTLRADGHVVWGKGIDPGHGGSGDSDCLYWGAKQTSESVTLGGNGGSWSTKSGEAGNKVWEDGKNVQLEATSGIITVKEESSPSMKSLTIVAGSATYNIVSDGSTIANVDGNLTVGAGATLCMGEGSVLQVKGSYSGDGVLRVENGGALTISGQATIKKATVGDGVLSLGSGSSISDLQGDPVNWEPDHGIHGQGNLTIESGNYTGSLKTDELTIAGNFTYDTPGANEGEKYENAAAVGGLTVDGKLTLNGGMLATSLRGKGSIIGQGTLQLTNLENNSFEGEVGVNLLYAGSSFTLSKYTGKSVTVTSGQLTLANGGSGIKLETLTFKGSGALIVEDTGSSVSGNVTLEKNQQLTLASGASLSVGSLTLSGGTLDVSGALGKLNAGALKTTETTTQVNLGMDVLDMESGTYVLLKYDILAEGSTSDHLRLESRITDERTRKQFNLELKSDSMNLLVSGESASLEWNQGSKGTWENSADGGLWDTETNDKTFFNGDSVTFHAAEEPVEVEVVGGVRPGSISVKGNQDVTFQGSGSVTGRGALTKEGSGTLRMKTNNASYSGDISVLGGTLEVGHENALGTGVVLVQNARFDAGNFAVNNPVKLAGTAGLKGANSVKELTFANGSSITADGAYVLGVNQHLLVDGHSKTRSATPVASSFSGGFVFAGGTLSLNGGLFDLTGATVSFNPENGSSTLDLTDWEGLTYGDYTLLQGHEGQWKAGSEALFNLSLDETLQRYAELRVSEDGSSIELVIKRPSEDPAISAALNRNQRAAYKTLTAIAERGTAVGKLAEMADSVANAQDARSAAALVDRLSGAELATILSAQTEGNMAHIRRLRNSIGTGHLVSPKHRTAAYVTGYNEDTQLEQDAKGLGYKRVEWGGTVGVETGLHRRSVMGLSLSSGRAYVTPDGGSRRYHEDNTRGDIYMVAYQSLNIRSTFSLGYGVHRFNVSRMLPDGSVSKNGNIRGNSLNMGEEMAYTIKMNEKTSIEPFFAVESSFNRVNSFTEYGVGTASISAQDSEAWATDLSLGVRTTHAFSVVPSAPSAVFTLQAALVASVGDNWEEMTLNYTGAPDMSYEVRPAKRNRWGFTIGASVGLPVSENFSVIGGANATLRGDSNEFSGSVGLRFNF